MPMMTKDSRKKVICYLCGRIIDGNLSREHVPPKQFFPSELRQRLNPNLRTLPSHLKCNKQFEKDEDYFLASCGVLADFAPVSDPLMRDLYKKLVQNPKNVMIYRILEEFREPTGDLILLNNKVIKELDFHRICRVVWKIVRGLHFIEFNTLLPEDTKHVVDAFQAGDILPKYFKFALQHTEIEGEFPPIFSYTHNIFEFVKSRTSTQIWGLSFWNSLIFSVRTWGPGLLPSIVNDTQE